MSKQHLYDSRPTMGADIEYFIYDTKSNKVVPASSVIGYAKHEACKGDYITDGMSVEIHIHPKNCKEFLASGIKNVIQTIRRDLDPRYKLIPQITNNFSEDWPKIKNKDKQIGCVPDYNVYLNTVNIKDHLESVPVRTNGGHIHISFIMPEIRTNRISNEEWPKVKDDFHKEETAIYQLLSKKSEEGIHNIDLKKLEKKIKYHKITSLECIEAMQDIKILVPFLDKTAGLFDVILSGSDGHNRRDLYGKAGDYRLKPYGIEYRTPSNKWACHHISTHIMFALARLGYILAIQYKKEEKKPELKSSIYYQIGKESVEKIINSGNISEAWKYLLKLGGIIRRDYTISKELCLINDWRYFAAIYWHLENVKKRYKSKIEGWNAAGTSGITNYMYGLSRRKDLRTIFDEVLKIAKCESPFEIGEDVEKSSSFTEVTGLSMPIYTYRNSDGELA